MVVEVEDEKSMGGVVMSSCSWIRFGERIKEFSP